MRTLELADSTQKEILLQLEITEKLLAAAATSVSGRECFAEIVPMPDLGLPHNVLRIRGGFFTGAYYRWDSSTPFIPIDATVNVCGVALFRTSAAFRTYDEFQARIAFVRSVWEEKTTYAWNYANGNHFIIYGQASGDGILPAGNYLVLHASAAEFKAQYNGLYPAQGNWYHNDIQVFHGEDGRYLRYLAGKPAERFASVAAMLENYQRERHRFCAQLIAGEANLQEEVLSIPHYGMPDESSIAIGCQWMKAESPLYLLLTRPKEPLFLIRAIAGGSNEIRMPDGVRMLTPHGLGVTSAEPLDMRYLTDELQLAGRTFAVTDSLAAEEFMYIREFDKQCDVSRVLNACPGNVVDEVRQIYSYYREGAR